LKVKVSARAAPHIRTASEWCGEQEKAPGALADELESAFALIRELPNAGEPVFHSTVGGVRRILLGRVGYHLYYRVDQKVVEILALWYSSRGESPQI
jgi:plasmid stabilization system protein ParE